MVSTIKFSAFSTVADLENGTTTVGVVAGANARINNPWTFLPSGTTAQRPDVVPAIYGRLRFNTQEQLYEYWDTTLNIWAQIQDSTDPAAILALLASHTVNEGASLIGLQDQSGVTDKTVQDLANATIITQTNTGVLQNGQALNALATGFMASAVTTGVVSSRVLTGTTNQINIANGDGSSAPVFSLSSTMSTPGTFTISGTTVTNAIINDSTMATATTSNLSTSSAIKAYIDTVVAGGFTFIDLCAAATTANFASNYANGTAGVGATLTALVNGAASDVDGIAIVLNTRVLFKNQTSAFENGVYTLTTVGDGATPAVYTRATDYDTAAEILPGTLVPIQAGTVNGGSIWLQTLAVVTVGTDSIAFIEFAQPSNTYVTLATTQTITGTKTFQSGAIRLAGSTSGYTAIQPQAISSSTVLSLPNATDTLVAIATTDTLTNKSISGSTNTLSNISYTSLATATAGSILAFDAGGAAALIAPGTAGEVLTSNGIGSTPTMQAAASGGVPVGTVIDFAAASAPTGYLPCDGSMSTVSRATYSGLFSVIGTTWGVGDGVTTFGIPNLSRQVAMGSGGTGTATIANFVGSVGGTEFINQTIAQLAAHDHPGSTFPGTFKATCTSGSSGAYNINPPTTDITVASQGTGADMNIIQPSAVVLKCIKY